MFQYRDQKDFVLRQIKIKSGSHQVSIGAFRKMTTVPIIGSDLGPSNSAAAELGRWRPIAIQSSEGIAGVGESAGRQTTVNRD